MKHVWKKLLAAMLAFTLLLSMTGVVAEEAETVYGVCTDVVNVRKQAGTGADLWFEVEEGHVAEILGTTTVGGALWYKVESPHPIPNGRTYTGYIMGDYFRPMTEAETEAYLKGDDVVVPPQESETEEPMRPSVDDALGEEDHVEYSGVAVIGAVGKLNTKTNFRSQPSTSSGTILAVIPKGTEVEVLAIPEDENSGWYRVRYDDQTGYVYCTLLDIIDRGEVAPDFGTNVNGAKGVVTADGVRFRMGNSTNSTIICELDEGTEVEILTVPDKISADDWYRVRYDGQVGYIQSNFIRVTDRGDLEDTDVVGTGKVTGKNVNFRTGPGTGYTIIAKLPLNAEVDLLIIPAKVDANHWYQVRYNGETGYVQSTYIKVLTQDVVVPDEDEMNPGVVSTGIVTPADGVNFRVGPSTNHSLLGRLPEGTVVELLSIPATIDDEHWYQVRYNNKTGYIQAPFIRVLTLNPDDLPDENQYGYAKLIKDGNVNLRQSPGGAVATSWNGKGSLMRIVGEPEGEGSRSWYPVYHVSHGQIYYVRADMIEVVMVKDGEIVAPPTAPESSYGYVITTEPGVNLRLQPDAGVIVQIPRGTVLTCVGPVQTPAQTNTSHYWYKVRYNGSTGYVRGDCVRVCSADGGMVETDPTLPDDPSQSTTVYGYIKMNTGNPVHVRKEPLKSVLVTLPHGTILPVMGQPTLYGAYGDYIWYPVRTADGVFGWVRGDCVMVCDENGDKIESGELPGPDVEEPDLVGATGKILKNTNFRSEMSTADKENIITVIPANTVVTVLRIPEDTKTGWYKITYGGEVGYVYANLIKMITMGEVDKPVTPPVVETPDLVGATGKILAKTNFRSGASSADDENIIAVIPAGTVVTVLRIPEDTKTGWYKIVYDGKEGYVYATLIEMITMGEEGEGGEDEEDTTPTSLGYIMITGNSVAVRKTPGGTVQTRVATNTVWPIIGASLTEDGVLWFNVMAGGKAGYVHSDYAFKLSPEQEESYLAGNGVPEIKPSPEVVPADYVITSTNGSLNIRASYSSDSTSVGKVGNGEVLQFFDTKKVGTVTWYCVLYDHQERWVHGNYVKVMTVAEYQAWAAAHPNLAPDANENLGYLKTNQANVYVRNAADGSTRVDQIAKKGTVMRYYSELIPAGGYNWYRVLSPAGEFVYIRSDLVEKCDVNGDELPIPVPDPGDIKTAPALQQEVEYSTLKLNAKGTKVTNLVNELINQGFYKGPVTDTFTSDVMTAVKAFQTVKGLYADGIAGSATQHALYGTVPIGAGDTKNLDFTIYPAEKIDWFTGGIQDMLPRGSKFKIYDVKTGIVWWAYRWAGGNHADIETLTAADSARLCQIYGVSNLQEVVDKNMWYPRRACLVTIGTRTFACSLDGMQHGTDTISGNGMDGQVCLHFTNSTGHSNGGQVSDSHAEAIEYAYKNAPYGQKK